MSVKKSYTVGIMDERKINKINEVISKFAEVTIQSSSHRYFDKQPIDANEVVLDVTFFQLKSDDEKSCDDKLSELIKNLDELNAEYILMDEEDKHMIVTVDYAGYIIVKFDKISFIKPKTYDFIDEIKTMKTDIGYCKGFKPQFRPIKEDLSEVLVNSEMIYLVSDSSENLKKFKDLISQKLLEFEPDFELEFGVIPPQEF